MLPLAQLESEMKRAEAEAGKPTAAQK